MFDFFNVQHQKASQEYSVLERINLAAMRPAFCNLKINVWLLLSVVDILKDSTPHTWEAISEHDNCEALA